jgi:chorismate mutase
MRRLFKEITDEHKNPEYEKAKNKCFYSINCFNINCNREHLVLPEAMQFINHIIKESISYENANSLYNIQFKNKSPVIESLNEPIDAKLENDLLNLTEEEEAEPLIRNDREDLKSNLLQELMVAQNNINELSKKIYNKDIEIQGLLNERKYLESKMHQNRAKVHQLTMNIMNLGSF